jgi:predicted nucleic acid-binding protein
VTYLLDVNALLALGFTAHEQHARVESWVKRLRKDDRLATCAIVELGFVRVATQLELAPDVAEARALLSSLKRARRPRFVALPDALGADALPAWVKTPAQTTDGHLVALASAHAARLASRHSRAW